MPLIELAPETGPETAQEPAGFPIRTLVERTGVSKELVHHYLRQGLLPRPDEGARGRYDDRHVGLLRQVRTLRDDHNVPLDIIRRLFEAFDFDPDRVSALTLSESLCKRLTRYFGRGELLSSVTLTPAALAGQAGISTQGLADYVAAGLVVPAQGADGEATEYSEYDAKVVALCAGGVRQGIPFDSFRTIASHLRIGFALEHSEFYSIDRNLDSGLDSARLVADLFGSREIAGAFVENVLHALTHRRTKGALQPLVGSDQALGDVVFRPSEAFVRRHGISDAVDDARQRLTEAPHESDRWLAVAQLLLQCGRDHEARFFVEEGLERWPADVRLRLRHAWVLLLSGQPGQADEQLKDLEVRRPDDAARLGLLRALTRFRVAAHDDRAEALIDATVTILAAVEEALAAASTASEPTRHEVSVLAGWLLTSLPAAFRSHERGVDLLVAAEAAIEAAPASLAGPDALPPGGWERMRLTAAFALFDCVRRLPEVVGAADKRPSNDTLRQRICALDPGSMFAQAVFLADGPARGDSPK